MAGGGCRPDPRRTSGWYGSDLLPLEHPEWFREGLELRFGAHLNQLAERAEQLFVPTTVVRSRLLERLSRQGLPSTVTFWLMGAISVP
jgi:hypothetical protein